MNFVFAFPFCIIAYLAGINVMEPSVADITYGSSEWQSSLQKGDLIRAVIKTNPHGKIVEIPIRSHNDYRREIIRLPVGTNIKLKAIRNNQEILIGITANGSKAIGIYPFSNIIQTVQKDSPAYKAGLEPGDEILEIKGEFTASAQDITSAISTRIGSLTPIKIRKASGEIKTLTVIPGAVKLTKPYYDLGLSGITPAIISDVRKDSPAEKANLQKGDRIIEVDTVPVKSWNKFIDIIKLSAGKKIILTISRGTITSTTLSTPIVVASDPAGRGFIGALASNTNEIGAAKKDSPLAGLGLAYGDRIIKATTKTQKNVPVEKKIATITQLQELAEKMKESPIDILVAKNSEPPLIITFTVTPTKISERADLGIGLKLKSIKSSYPLKEAIIKGTRETLDLGLLTYQMMKKLFQGEESVTGLAGPIGIIRVSYYMAREGVGDFLWLLALISINLAILNLLPIPILDGGTIVFCFIEKIKGSPVGFKVQAIAQYIGITILLTLVALTTVNDILR
jgi:regulator of sigma E protease